MAWKPRAQLTSMVNNAAGCFLSSSPNASIHIWQERWHNQSLRNPMWEAWEPKNNCPKSLCGLPSVIWALHRCLVSDCSCPSNTSWTVVSQCLKTRTNTSLLLGKNLSPVVSMHFTFPNRIESLTDQNIGKLRQVLICQPPSHWSFPKWHFESCWDSSGSSFNFLSGSVWWLSQGHKAFCWPWADTNNLHLPWSFSQPVGE